MVSNPKQKGRVEAKWRGAKAIWMILVIVVVVLAIAQGIVISEVGSVRPNVNNAKKLSSAETSGSNSSFHINNKSLSLGKDLGENSLLDAPSCSTKTVKCVGTLRYNETCLYQNFHVQLTPKGSLDFSIWAVQNTKEYAWFTQQQTHLQLYGTFGPFLHTIPIHVKQFSSEFALEQACKQTYTANSTKAGLTVFFKAYYGNIGHGLFDGAWPVFAGLSELGILDGEKTWDLPFDIVSIGLKSKARHNMLRQAYQALASADPSMDAVVFGNNAYAEAFGESTIVERAVIGSGRKGQSTKIPASYELPGGRKHLRLFRDRIYRGLGLMTNRTRTCLEGNEKDRKIRIRIFDNKRYSEEERTIIAEAIGHYQSANSSLHNPIDIAFVDWRKYPSFKDQVKLVADVDIYVSGPGTGLVFSALLPDGAVVLNLGDVRGGFMDEYFAAASPHLRAVYYNRCRHRQIESKPFHESLVSAKSLYDSCFRTSDDGYNSLENLSPVGRSFVSLSQMLQTPSSPKTNWSLGLWAEDLIFENEKAQSVEKAAKHYHSNTIHIKTLLQHVRNENNISNCAPIP